VAKKEALIGPLELGTRGDRAIWPSRSRRIRLRLSWSRTCFCSVAPRSRVDLAGDALGVVVDAAEETVAEELALVARDAYVELDVAGGFFEVKGSGVVANGDALVEGFVGSEAEFVGQVSVTVNAVGPVLSPDLILLFGRDRPHFDQTMETRTVFSVQITLISSKLRKETWHRREWYLWV